MTSRKQNLECTDTSLKIPSEVWQISDDGCDYDAMVRNKDFQNNSDAADDSYAYDPDFETSEEVDQVEEMAVGNCVASHVLSLRYNKAHSSISVNNQATVASRVSFVNSPHNISQSDPQALRHETSSDSGSLMQSSRGDSCVTVTPLSSSCTPRKVTFNSYCYPRTDAKHSISYLGNSEISSKPRDLHFAHHRFSETGVRVQNVDYESQNKKNLNDFQFNPRCIARSQKQKQTSSVKHFEKDGLYDWGSCSDQDSSKEEYHSSSDKGSPDYRVKGNKPAPTASEASNVALSEPIRKVYGASDSGLEMGDRIITDYCIESQMDDDLRWRNSTEKTLENGTKHSAFDLALVLSQPEICGLAPQFKLEDLENYSQLSQTVLKEKMIRLATLLQACRDVITWNKEERQQLLAEREALRKDHAEYARNLEELNEQMDKMEKEKAKSDEDFTKLMNVANELKMELRKMRYELVRKEEETRREMIQREEEMRREMIQKMKEMREEMMLKENQMRFELMRKEEEMCHEIESLQIMLDKEKERHAAEEESTQRELFAYKDSVKQKLNEAEQKVAQRMEQLQEECQRYMLSIRQKGKHSKSTHAPEIEQNKNISTAEHCGTRTTSLLLSGRSSSVLMLPLTESPYYQELGSKVSASDRDTVTHQPKRSTMFSSANSPLARFRLASSVSSAGARPGSRAQRLKLGDYSGKSAVDGT